jgi:hypothetical protein
LGVLFNLFHMSAQNIEGTYDLATGEWVRSVVISGEPPREVMGSETALDAEMDRIEARGGSFVWEETSRAVAPQSAQPAAMTPLELQSTALDRADFDALVAKTVSTGRMFYALGFLGIATYGDVLALGSDAIVAQSTEINSRIGERTLSYLKGAVLKRTGYHLPEHRATPAEQLFYFDDIREATVALGLPFGTFRHVAQTSLGHEHRTIGLALQLTRLEFEQSGRARMFNIESEALFRFIGSLRRKIVAPFDHAKAGRSSMPKQ